MASTSRPQIPIQSIRFFTTVVRIVDVKFTGLRWHFNYSHDSGKLVDLIELRNNKIAFKIVEPDLKLRPTMLYLYAKHTLFYYRRENS